MKIRLCVTAFSVCILLVIGGLFLNYGDSGSVVAEHKGAEKPEVLSTLNMKARAAKRGGVAEIREVANAVLDPYADGNPIVAVSGVLDEVKDRLVRAEVQYRKSGAGVPETNVVRVINSLSKDFELPDYSTTDLSEVRSHRMTLFLETPSLTTMKASKQKSEAKQSGGIDSQMSPLEAANVTLSLAYQKVFNAGYQRNPNERNSRSSSESVAENAEDRSGRTAEMLRLVQKQSLALALPSQLTRFAQRSLDRLGIPR